jgi:hypothetical protein
MKHYCANASPSSSGWRAQGVPSDFVDDVVQETLLTIHQARRTYDPSRSFTAWLRTIAQRRAIDGLRRRGRTQKREIHTPLAYQSHSDPSGDPDQAALQIGHAEVLNSAIGSGARLLACLIVAPRQGYDEPGFLSYTIRPFCPTSARLEPFGLVILIGLLIILPMLGAQLSVNLNFISGALAVATRAIINLILYVTGNS